MSKHYPLFYAWRAMFFITSLASATTVGAQKVDYSVLGVPEERSLNLMQITRESDYVCLPQVKRSQRGVDWYSNCVLGVTPDGKELAYLSTRNNTTNIFIKSIDRQGASRQRTNRTAVTDFSISADGKDICFTEAKGRMSQVFVTDAHDGYVCRQVTTGNQDYSPVFNPSKTQIFFTRAENRGFSIWAYDMKNNFLSAYVAGLGASPASDDKSIYVGRVSSEGRGEIWKIDFKTGEEVCILSDAQRSFLGPQLSPDGTHLLVTGSSRIEVGNGSGYWNTDIYTVGVDGTGLNQLTFHAADDLSPVWSADGQHIYFISQRGSAEGIANVWRMDFTPVN